MPQNLTEDKRGQKGAKEVPSVEPVPVTETVKEGPQKRVPKQIVDEMVDGKRKVTIIY